MTFGLYQLHKLWGIPSNIVGSLALTWPSSRFRSNWMAIIVHGMEVIPGLGIALVILGLLSR